MALEITTNGQTRDLIPFFSLTEKEQKEFDYIKGDDQFDNRIFRYRDYVYDVTEFIRIDPVTLLHHPEMAGWDGMQSDTFFSGVLVKFSADLEAVIVATYFS